MTRVCEIYAENRKSFCRNTFRRNKFIADERHLNYGRNRYPVYCSARLGIVIRMDMENRMGFFNPRKNAFGIGFTPLHMEFCDDYRYAGHDFFRNTVCKLVLAALYVELPQQAVFPFKDAADVFSGRGLPVETEILIFNRKVIDSMIIKIEISNSTMLFKRHIQIVFERNVRTDSERNDILHIRGELSRNDISAVLLVTKTDRRHQNSVKPIYVVYFE